MSKSKQPPEPLTKEQIALAADPGVAFAAFDMDEVKMLRTIVSLLCLDDRCKEFFDEAWLEGYSGLPHYSSYGSDYDHIERWMWALRKQIEAKTKVLRRDLRQTEKQMKRMEQMK